VRLRLPRPRLPRLGPRLPRPRLPAPKGGLAGLGPAKPGLPGVGRRALLLAAPLVAYALGAYGGLQAVRGALHGLVYPAWLLSLTYVGVLHGAEGTLAVLALAPFLALSGYVIVVSGILLTGGWSAAWASAPQLLAAALASAAVYASSYAAARLAVRGRVWWEAEGPPGQPPGQPAGEPAGVPAVARAPFGRVGGWLRRLRPPRRAGKRGRRGGRPL
jgi:hypothetical protein